MHRPQLFHSIREVWESRISLKYMAAGWRENDEGMLSVYSCPFIIFLPPSLPASCFKPKCNVYLLSTALGWIPQYIFQINLSISDLWYQPCSMNQLTWKPPRAWTLVSNREEHPNRFSSLHPYVFPEVQFCSSNFGSWERALFTPLSHFLSHINSD